MTGAAILESILADRSLWEERNFVSRFEAIEMLEEVIAFGAGSDPVEAWVAGSGEPQGAAGSLGLAELKAGLEEVDDRLFARLRAEIAAGGHRGNAFRELLLAYCGSPADCGSVAASGSIAASGSVAASGSAAAGGEEYDALDVFVNRLCSYLPMPSPVRLLEPEMVDYHKTPGRVVLELARYVGPGDVFIDLGAGLGQVVLLVHLLTGAAGRGLEIEPAFCRYARDCATGLGLSQAFDPGAVPGETPDTVSFIEGDARFVGYNEGTVFFMYTPFTGELLATVFELMRREAVSRSFTLVTYGPCTRHAARQSWLRAVDPADAFCVFRAVDLYAC